MRKQDLKRLQAKLFNQPLAIDILGISKRTKPPLLAPKPPRTGKATKCPKISSQRPHNELEGIMKTSQPMSSFNQSIKDTEPFSRGEFWLELLRIKREHDKSPAPIQES